jgi:hypothetical protein
MTRRENLRDQYEDALFALLMDDLAWQEGERLLELNERLKNDPDADVPEEVMARCRKVINREFTKKTALKAGRVSWNVFKRAAVAACMTVLLFSVAFAASETVRINTLNLVIEVFDRYTDYSFRPAPEPAPEESDNVKFSGFEVGWVPEGLTMTEQKTMSGYMSTIYEGSHGEYLSIRLYSLGEAGVMGINTEDAVVEDITINEWNASLITTDHFQVIIPFPERKQFLCASFFTEETPPEKEELLRIIEGISLY